MFFIRNFVDERDQKSGRFSGSGVGESHDIPAVQNMGNDLVLDRSRLFVSVLFKSLKDRGIDLEVGKLVFGNKMLHFFGDDSGLVDES